MFRAFIRYIRAFGYMITGRINAAKEVLNENVHVVAATFDEVLEKRTARIHTVRASIADLAGIRDELKDEISKKTAKLEKLTSRTGAAERAMQKRINLLKIDGLDKAAIQLDSEFVRHRSAFMDMSSQVTELEEEIGIKEKKFQERTEQVENYKTELQSMKRGIEDLKAEKRSTIADIEISKQEKSINDALSGISQDTTDKELDGIRQTRKRVVQEANFSREMADNEVSKADAEYDEYAAEAKGDELLDGLLDWGDDSESLDDAKVKE